MPHYPHRHLYGSLMKNDLLRAPEFAALLGVNERRARQLLSELESAGFQLTTVQHGARAIPKPLAAAVRACRQAGLELTALRSRADLAPYLCPDAPLAEAEAVDLLELRTELAIVREILSATLNSLSSGSQKLGYTAPSDWGFLAVPDPRRGL